MRKGFLSSLTALLAGTSLAVAQPPAPVDPSAPVPGNGAGQPPAVSVPRDAGAPALPGTHVHDLHRTPRETGWIIGHHRSRRTGGLDHDLRHLQRTQVR